MPFESFTELDVYKECRKLRKSLSIMVNSRFPAHEKHRLSDQIIRSSRSITACLAEGHGRHYFKEGIKFCRMARGSISETLEHLITAYDENYIDITALQEYKSQIDLCNRLLGGYVKFLQKAQHTQPPY